jgi:hypothetical protein
MTAVSLCALRNDGIFPVRGVTVAMLCVCRFPPAMMRAKPSTVATFAYCRVFTNAICTDLFVQATEKGESLQMAVPASNIGEVKAGLPSVVPKKSGVCGSKTLSMDSASTRISSFVPSTRMAMLLHSVECFLDTRGYANNMLHCFLQGVVAPRRSACRKTSFWSGLAS